LFKKLNRLGRTTGGKIGGVAVVICLLALAVRSVLAFMHGDAPAMLNERTYITTDGRTFQHKDAVGESNPIANPFDGQANAYPAEACYWNKDGTFKDTPTWVLMNGWIQKPGPTFCPDCGRLVVGHNPRAEAGRTPPPTEEEWKAAHAQ
jgi:hypothetical protein